MPVDIRIFQRTLGNSDAHAREVAAGTISIVRGVLGSLLGRTKKR